MKCASLLIQGCESSWLPWPEIQSGHAEQSTGGFSHQVFPLAWAELSFSWFCSKILSPQPQNCSSVFQQRLRDHLKNNMGHLQTSLAVSAVSLCLWSYPHMGIGEAKLVWDIVWFTVKPWRECNTQFRVTRLKPPARLQDLIQTHGLNCWIKYSH